VVICRSREKEFNVTYTSSEIKFCNMHCNSKCVVPVQNVIQMFCIGFPIAPTRITFSRALHTHFRPTAIIGPSYCNNFLAYIFTALPSHCNVKNCLRVQFCFNFLVPKHGDLYIVTRIYVQCMVVLLLLLLLSS
jgi:hypothetical protein